MPNVSLAAAQDSVLVVQLTDSHLFAEADGALLGLNTADSLARVVELALAEQGTPDLVLASGDLSQDGSLESYKRFRQLSSRISAPARWFPGNHDELPAMREASQGTDLMEPVLDIGNWRIVLLDSLLPGSVAGYLRDDQLELLDQALAQAPARHQLVSLHHHPVSIGSEWMDRIGLRNAEALFEVVDRHPSVRLILWGHIHQAFDQTRNDVRLLASPSTGIQFMPGSDDFQVDTRAPGYRWLRLYHGGRIETGVSRLAGFEFVLKDGDKGY